MAFLFLDKKNVAIGSVLLTAIFSLGVIIGYYANQPPTISYIGQSSALIDTKDSDNLINTLMADQFSSEKDLIEEVIENVDTNNLRSFLKELTREPHIAGHRRDNELIEYIRKAWIDMGLDHVELAEYDFFLSWPNQVNFFNYHFLRMLMPNVSRSENFCRNFFYCINFQRYPTLLFLLFPRNLMGQNHELSF